MAAYDPRIIEQYSDRLYRKAMFTTVAWTVVFTIVGGLLGNWPQIRWYLKDSPAPAPNTDGSILLGILLGAAAGLWFGLERSFRLKLRAQLALCQLQVEYNTRTQAHAVQAQTAAARQASA